MLDLGTLPGHDHSVAYALNGSGQIVGWSSILAQTPGTVRAVLWTLTDRCQVDIDLLPGDPRNLLRLRSTRGYVPLAILSSSSFAASSVDPASVTLGDLFRSDTPVASGPGGAPLASLVDVDGDGDLDLLLLFDKAELIANGDVNPATTKVVMLGRQFGGTLVRGDARVVVR
jgi:hypothetical protein